MLSEGTIPSAPIMDQQAFADSVGVSIKSVRDYVGKGYLPVVKLSNSDTESKRSFINLFILQEWLRDQGEEWLIQMRENQS